MRSYLQGSRFRQVVHAIKERKGEKTVRVYSRVSRPIPSGPEGGEHGVTNGKVEEAIMFDIG